KIIMKTRDSRQSSNRRPVRRATPIGHGKEKFRFSRTIKIDRRNKPHRSEPKGTMGSIGKRAKCTSAQLFDELQHDPEKWVPVFRKRSCSDIRTARDDDSKKSHPALGRQIMHYPRLYARVRPDGRVS